MYFLQKDAEVGAEIEEVEEAKKKLDETVDQEQSVIKIDK